LKSKLRVGTEIIVAFPPQRVMAAPFPIADYHIQPQASAEPSSLSFDAAALRAKRIASGVSG
jgi:two-component system, cell cycle sensor histidine kinase PleC